jgi:hypothetical protein
MLTNSQIRRSLARGHFRTLAIRWEVKALQDRLNLQGNGASSPEPLVVLEKCASQLRSILDSPSLHKLT